MSETMEKRTTPARPDLAAEFLRGKVEAARFVPGKAMRVAEGIIDLRAAPTPEAGVTTQALFGEEVMVYEDHEGWAWGQLKSDGYVGYMSANALRSLGPEHAPTHRVAVPRSFCYPDAGMKNPVLQALPLGACVAATEARGDYVRLADGEFVYSAHLQPLDAFASDFVAIAEQFLHVPYLWGGKTSMGLDCSGLLQLSLGAAGIDAPRDSDMIQRWAARLDIGADLARLRRGDLVFWNGHCGVMQDAGRLLHANGHHMQVASEPLREAAERIAAKSFGAVTGFARLATSTTPATPR